MFHLEKYAKIEISGGGMEMFSDESTWPFAPLLALDHFEAFFLDDILIIHSTIH